MKIGAVTCGLAAAALLAACSSHAKPPPAVVAAPPPVAAPAPPAPVASAAPAPNLTPIPPPRPPPRDMCGAWELAALVGKPRSEIPVPVDPSRRRVYCTTCSVTQDYDPRRLNILFDAKTGLVSAVKCG